MLFARGPLFIEFMVVGEQYRQADVISSVNCLFLCLALYQCITDDNMIMVCMVKYHVIHYQTTAATLLNSVIKDKFVPLKTHYSACSKQVYNGWRKVAFPFPLE